MPSNQVWRVAFQVTQNLKRPQEGSLTIAREIVARRLQQAARLSRRGLYLSRGFDICSPVFLAFWGFDCPVNKAQGIEVSLLGS